MDSADSTYFGNDPQDLRKWYDGELQRHYWELGPEGSMRLWTQPAHVRRNWWGINEENARPGESTRWLSRLTLFLNRHGTRRPHINPP